MRPHLIRCDFRGDVFLAVWLHGDRYVVGWLTPDARMRYSYSSRERAAEAYDLALQAAEEAAVPSGDDEQKHPD